MLLTELKKIEARKRERERKTQDLQKLISRADSGVAQPAHSTNANTDAGNVTPSSNANSARRHDKKLHKKKIPAQQRPVRAPEAVVSLPIYNIYILTADTDEGKLNPNSYTCKKVLQLLVRVPDPLVKLSLK